MCPLGVGTASHSKTGVNGMRYPANVIPTPLASPWPHAVHYLSGPIAVTTAEPGDLLKVELLNLGALPGDEWGFCGSFHKDNGTHPPCAIVSLPQSSRILR